jgi:hypothetical protein
MISLISNQNGYCEKSLLQLGPYYTGPVYCEKYRDRVGSQHYSGDHPGGECKTLPYTISAICQGYQTCGELRLPLQ